MQSARDDLPMLVRCYHAAHTDKTGTSNLVLADMSGTHEPPTQREKVLALAAVPSENVSDGIVHALGLFHARWWQHDALRSQSFAKIRPWYRDPESFQWHCERRRREWAVFADTAAGEVPDATLGIYKAALAAMPSLWERFLAPRVIPLQGVTLTHGDCYLGQFLCPRGPEASSTYIVDFGDVSGNFGSYDLVYALCTFWTRDQRREGGRELRLLHRYHQALMAGGVGTYSWDQLVADYRLMLLFMIFDPVWNQTDGSPREYWVAKMRCLTDAYDDWDCARLLHH